MSKKNAARAGQPASTPVPPASGWWKAVFALLLGLACGFLGAHFLDRGQADMQSAVLKAHFGQTIAAKQAALDQVQAKLDLVQGQLAVEKSTRSGLEATLQKSQDELGQARDQLAFYDQLLPAGPKGAISVRAFDVQMLGSTLQYRVLLMRNATGDTPFNGLMQFMATGSQHGKTVKIKLEPVQVSSGATGDRHDNGLVEFALNFDQFQRSRGLLSLPDGFIPQTVTLDVLEGKTVRVSSTVKVSSAD